MHCISILVFLLNQFGVAVSDSCFWTVKKINTFLEPLRSWEEQNWNQIPFYSTNNNNKLPVIETLRDVNAYTDDLVSLLSINTLGVIGLFSYLTWFFMLLTSIAIIFVLLNAINATNPFKFFTMLNYIFYMSHNALTSKRAVILIFSANTAIIFTGFYITFLSSLPTLTSSIITSVVFSILILILMLPVCFFLNWGLYAPIYVKGQSISKSLLFEALTDYMHFLSFFIRLNIQLIRLLVICGVFFTYNEMYFEFIYPNYNNNSLILNINLSSYLNATVGYIIGLIMNILYEIGHLWAIIMMQSNAFGLIVFVITQFLYSAYILENLLSFFEKKN